LENCRQRKVFRGKLKLKPKLGKEQYPKFEESILKIANCTKAKQKQRKYPWKERGFFQGGF